MSSIKPIKVLSAELANQIAAGEVVERPASVVKELVENSLDANASEILVEIEQGGSKKILIRDNGNGIEKSQLELALSRHATSKIENIYDLEQITSMGFRGEALASISSVSRLTLTSKPFDQKEAWQAYAEGQHMSIVVKPAAHPNGTSIEVLDLFFNTPARRKFLKTPKTEFQHIETLVKRLALTNPNVKFSLFHNQKRCFNFLKVDNIQKRVEQICSKSFVQDCAPVNYQYDSITLTGFASKLGKGQPTRDHQYTFVNGRIMKDKLISHALRQAYEDTLPPQMFPAYVLYLNVPPDELDINVHPAKHEVRFHKSRQIHDIVYKAITQSIGMSGNYELEQPQHDYIIPLKSQATNFNNAKEPDSEIGSPYPGSSTTQRSFLSTGSFSNPKPSKKELMATHDFYSSIGRANISPRVLDEAAENANIHPSNTHTDSKQQKNLDTQDSQIFERNMMYCEPYIVFKKHDTKNLSALDFIHVSQLVSLVINQQIMLSTTSQPLLMPVSRVMKAEDKQVFDSANCCFQKWNFELILSHGKVILKKVPSGIRHLPWANILGKLSLSYDLNEQTYNSQACLQKFTDDIAKAWVEVILPDQTQVLAWLSSVNKQQLEKLLEHNKASIDLRQVWQETRGDSAF